MSGERPTGKDALHARASDALADESVGVDVADPTGLDPEPPNAPTGSVVDTHGARRDDLDRPLALIGTTHLPSYGMPCCGHRISDHSSESTRYGYTSRCACCNQGNRLADAIMLMVEQ